ncbi:MAG: NfeD family protein [Planctomycetes bacterium]|nr:NfeD family protein [Planctomycetota bacterium]
MIDRVLLELPEQVVALDPWAQVAAALGLLAIAAGLLVVEFFVISWGMLTFAAAACAFGACALAFAASPAIGWLFVAVCPLLLLAIVPWGFRRMAESRAVPKTEITADAGYRHEAERLGIVVGAMGELVTDALPTGRAHFAGGDIDVTAIGGPLTRGARVVVLRIEGAIVAVRPA